jgi:hypothetical protein
MVDEWTHEQLDALDALKNGDASPLVALLINGDLLCSDFKDIIQQRLDKGEFIWREDKPKVGRPVSNRLNELFCINVFIKKQKLRKAEPHRRVVEIEQQLAETHALNVDDLRRAITRGKQCLEYFEKNHEMPWSREMLNLNKKSRGKTL